MAEYYVSDVSGDDGAGTTWATAKTGIVAGYALCTSDGDVLYVDSAHNESSASLLTMTTGTTVTQSITVISVDRNGSTGTGHNGYKPGAQITTTGGAACSFVKSMKSYGVNYTADNSIIFSTDDAAYAHYDAKLKISSGSSNQYLYVIDSHLDLYNCELEFGSTGQGLAGANDASYYLYNCSISSTGTALLRLVHEWDWGTGSITICLDNCDLSNLATNGEIFQDIAGRVMRGYASNCLLPVGGQVVNAASPPTPGVENLARIESYGCTTAADDNPNQLWVVDGAGVVTNDEAVYLDATNAFSFLVQTTSVSNQFRPFQFLLGEVYAAAGATIGVELITETSLDDSEFWIDVVYPTTTAGLRQTATGQHSFNNVIVQPFTSVPTRDTTGTALTTSTNDGTDWVGESVYTTPVYQKAEIDLTNDVTTASEAGVVQVWVSLAGANLECYVDSNIVIT